MKLLLLHLSDIHIKSEGDFILKRATLIADAMSGLDTLIEGCIVVVTGDIAYSGQADQYVLAEQFLDQLKARLVKTVMVSEIHVVLAPGNHDCDFSTPNQVRDIVGRVHKIMLHVRDCGLSSTARGVEYGSFVLPYGRAI